MSSSKNMQNDYRTFGFVLKRTNYGEADRIINIITATGRVSAIAKGVRKNKSKLASGIEPFSYIDFTIHSGKSNLSVVTSAKMLKYYGEILKDYSRVELAGKILKTINKMSENTDDAVYYNITKQCLEALNDGANLGLIDGWFYLNIKKTVGEELNFYYDSNGLKLTEVKRYDWDSVNGEFVERADGKYGADVIKLLRVMSVMNLKMIMKIRINDDVLGKAMEVIQMTKS